MKDFYILAMDGKPKIKYLKCGAILPNCIEAFHIKADNVKEAMKNVSSKTTKRFLTVLRFKEIEVEINERF